MCVFLSYYTFTRAQALPQCTIDNNNDGVVNTQDFLNLVSQFGQNCNPLGTITSINCSGSFDFGTLTVGTAASSNVYSIISIAGGNGGYHNGQIVASTGVSGLYAELLPGTLSSVPSSLIYTIKGTPASTGTANFAISIGGQSCTLSRNVTYFGQDGTTTHTCGATNVHNSDKSYGSMTDQQGNVYKTVIINGREWMAENLKTTTFSNGESIPNVTGSSQWSSTALAAWCYYNNDSQNNCPYGKLYNWYAVADPRGLCPTGWHVPTDAEWTTLTNLLGESVAGGMLKSTGQQYWISPNTDATNVSGFSGLPGGYRSYSNGNFYSVGASGYWWSSTESSAVNAWSRTLFNNFGNAFRYFTNKPDGFSVRCLRD